jgi:hypothetical protein
MEGKNEQTRNSQGCHSGVDGASTRYQVVAATDGEAVTYRLPRRHPIVDMEMVRYGDGGDRNAMPTRTTSKMVTFARPFTLKGVDRILPAGNYRVVTDEELIEELSFPVYRRVSTMIFVPAKSASSVEMVAVDPQDLQAAQERDLNHGS